MEKIFSALFNSRVTSVTTLFSEIRTVYCELYPFAFTREMSTTLENKCYVYITHSIVDIY